MDVDFIKHRFEDGHVGVLTRTKFRLGIRHVQLIYMFVCSVVFGIMRGSIGISLLALTDSLRQNDTYIQAYDWNSRIQGTICSSFFFGLALMMVPAETLMGRMGGKFVLSCALFVNGALYVALPTIVNKGGWMALCNAQFIMGMTQACLVPANRALIYSWIPPIERGWLSVFVFGGIQLGVVISFPLCAALSKAPLGWELVFYGMAMMSLSTAVVWSVLTASGPGDHPAVGDKEKEAIEEAMGYYKKKQLPIPWLQIMKCPMFWGLTCAHIGTNTLVMFFLANVPGYFVYGLGLTLSEASWFMILPFVMTWVVYATAAPSFERFYKIGFISYTTSVSQFRKIINTLGVLGTVTGLCLLAYLGATASIAVHVILLSGTLGSVGLQYVGFLENHRDVTGNFAGTLVTMSSVGANIVGATVPFLTGLVLNDHLSDLSRWRIVFVGLATMVTACNILYIVLGTSERQYWDTIDTKKSTKFGYYNDVHQMELDEMRDQNFIEEKS